MQNESAFVDANIFLDVARKRKGWKASALALTEIKRINGFVSSLTVAIIYFIKLRTMPPLKARQETRELIQGLRIVAVTSEVVNQALDNTAIEDFEDAMQFYCARTAAKAIVTRNKRDYEAVGKELEVMTPEQFLARL
jgi:predicted nucleic acid-binding protein